MPKQIETQSPQQRELSFEESLQRHMYLAKQPLLVRVAALLEDFETNHHNRCKLYLELKLVDLCIPDLVKAGLDQETVDIFKKGWNEYRKSQGLTEVNT